MKFKKVKVEDLLRKAKSLYPHPSLPLNGGGVGGGDVIKCHTFSCGAIGLLDRYQVYPQPLEGILS